MTAADHVEYRRFVPAEADLLAEFLTTEDWPYHGPRGRDAAQIRQDAEAGRYDNDQVRTFWIVTETEVGLIRLFDLADDTPLFDLRIRAAYRGMGLGTRALRWLTGYLFTEFPGLRRIEGHTRQDNHAMRRTFTTCGYVRKPITARPGRASTERSTTPSATRSFAPTGRPAPSRHPTGTTSHREAVVRSQ